MPNDDSNNQTVNDGEATGSPTTWESWLDNQGEDVKKMYLDHTQGLLNTVKTTRDERDTVKGQLKEALKKADKGSESEKALTDALDRLDKASKKADFLEDAVRPEIGCKNPKTAFALAVAENLFLSNGAPDWETIKKSAPELFGVVSVKSNAGSGTNNPPAKQTMNDLIRGNLGR